ncbi:hypothetical protein KKF84_14590 [Myxococcota bacterium]|nr:hypothetical protein [Myxococcota bacterium]MBU1536550.1 hypothetical protein [Myxococcota bacterium]
MITKLLPILCFAALAGLLPGEASAQAMAPSCPQGYYYSNGQCNPCQGGYCNTYGNTYRHNYRSPIAYPMEAPGEKSVALAFLLEFMLGFGTGHFYAGNQDWAMVGLLSGVAMYGGIFYLIDAAESNGNIAMPITLLVLGAIGKLVSAIAAPIVTSEANREKRTKFFMNMGSSGGSLSAYDTTLISISGKEDHKAGFLAPSGAAFFLPLVSVSF